jgi:hypothetical protein
MKNLIGFPVQPDPHHDALHALELLAGAIALACVFWLHPFWTSAAVFTAASTPLIHQWITATFKHEHQEVMP